MSVAFALFNGREPPETIATFWLVTNRKLQEASPFIQWLCSSDTS